MVQPSSVDLRRRKMGSRWRGGEADNSTITIVIVAAYAGVEKATLPQPPYTGHWLWHGTNTQGRGGGLRPPLSLSQGVFHRFSMTLQNLFTCHGLHG